jgi:cytochrome c
MFDTMTISKTIAGLCIAGLVMLFGTWFAHALFFSSGHGHHQEWAYLGDLVEEDDGAETAAADAEPEMTFEDAFAMANADDGARSWRKCAACHKLDDGANATGPHLHALLGRDIASVADFAYSDAMLAHAGEVWTPESLNAWLTNPDDFAPGNKMGRANGVRDLQDRADLIAYLQAQGG